MQVAQKVPITIKNFNNQNNNFFFSNVFFLSGALKKTSTIVLKLGIFDSNCFTKKKIEKKVFEKNIYSEKKRSKEIQKLSTLE